MTTNTDRMIAYLKAIDMHDRAALRDAYADGVAIRAPGVALEGADAALGWIDTFLRAFPDLRHDLVSTTEADDRVTIEAQLTATHTGPLAGPNGDIPPTGRQVGLDYTDICGSQTGGSKASTCTSTKWPSLASSAYSDRPQPAGWSTYERTCNRHRRASAGDSNGQLPLVAVHGG